MANLVIYSKGSDDIRDFLVDCVQCSNDFRGINKSVAGVKSSHFDILWTMDTATFDPEARTWDKKVSELTPCEPGAVVSKTSKSDVEKAIIIRNFASNLKYSSVGSYIDENITDLDSAKDFLKKLTKAVIAISRIQDR